MEMARDPSCRVVLTISGAMTVAKQGRIFCDLIDRGLVHAVIATGALMAHGLTESIGLTHYRYDPTQSDTELFDQGYNRIYDTLEMEANLNEVAQLVASVIDQTEPEGGVWSSARICRALGKRLSAAGRGAGSVAECLREKCPRLYPGIHRQRNGARRFDVGHAPDAREEGH